MKTSLLLICCLLLPASALAAAPVPASDVISAPGDYVLAADRASPDMFNIKITVPGVRLDLNGKAVSCLPADPATATTFGVYAANLSDTTIRDGRITGCMFGVHAGYSQRTTIEGVDFSGNTYIGANLGGTGNVVRNSTFARIAGYRLEAYAIGLNSPGPDCVVEGNIFRDLYCQPQAATTLRGEGWRS